jgi:hypothetical protein
MKGDFMFPQLPGGRIRGLGQRRMGAGPTVVGLLSAKGQTLDGLV